MKLEFLGMKKQGRKSGCSACGKRRVSSYDFERTKTMTLPSGTRKVFTAGEVYEIAEADGLFLLGLTYDLNGKQENMFKEVT